MSYVLRRSLIWVRVGGEKDMALDEGEGFP